MSRQTHLERLSPLATRRTCELFIDDMRQRRGDVERALSDKRVLVIGGGGSIGAATVALLASFPLRALHVVDQNENSLAELVRDLRSSAGGLRLDDFRALPVDFGSPIMHRFLCEQTAYQYVLNFAAIKHVRSEKDTYSVLQMLDTNVVKPCRLLQWLRDRGGTELYFCVSTDKAANPVNLMGASKRLMEHMVFCGEVVTGLATRRTSARFANVAFSDGSLLQAFLCRLEKRQPLAVPCDTRRFFVSLPEAARICLLASVCAADRQLLVPRLDPLGDLHDLESIARAVLEDQGYEPSIYTDEDAARESLDADLVRGRYPLLLTPLDTSGEKPYEEFVGEGERCEEIGMKDLLGVQYRPAPTGRLKPLLALMQEMIQQPGQAIDIEQIAGVIASALPEFLHARRERHLDSRM